VQPLLIAVQFLTRLPVPPAHDYSPETVGRSLAWYPLVGLLIGAILTAAAWLLQGQQPLLAAAIVLALWVGLSGWRRIGGCWRSGWGVIVCCRVRIVRRMVIIRRTMMMSRVRWWGGFIGGRLSCWGMSLRVSGGFWG